MALVNVNPVRKIFVFLVFFSVGHAVCGEVIRLTSGTDYIFKPRITGNPQTILWKYKGNKVVEFESDEPYWYRLKGRAALNTTTGELTLLKLNKDDSGLYESEIQVAGVIQSSKHDIKVIDAVPKPNVTCEVNSTKAKLVCSVESSAVYEWNGPDVDGKKGQTITVPKEGSEILYICIVKNEVSKNSRDFYLKECFGEATAGDNKVTIIVIVVIVIVILLLVVCILLYIRCWKRKHPGYSLVNTALRLQQRASDKDPPGDPEDGSDRENPDGNQTPFLTGQETKALEKKDSISNHVNNLTFEVENENTTLQDPEKDDQILAHNDADREGEERAEPPDNTEQKHGSTEGQSLKNSIPSTQTGLEETPSEGVGDPLEETVEQGTDGEPSHNVEEPERSTQTVEGPPHKDTRCVAEPQDKTKEQGTDGGEDPPSDPEDGSDRGNDEGNPTPTLTDLEETKALDSISNHGNDQGQAASKPAVISNNFTNEKTSASGKEEKIEKPENLAGKPKENSSSGIVEKKIEKFEQLAWKPKEISSRTVGDT